MAAQNLTTLTRSEFPQVLAQALNQEVTRVNRVVEAHLSICCYVSAESRWRACDAVECRQIATIHDIATEQEYCAAHYRDVQRG